MEKRDIKATSPRFHDRREILTAYSRQYKTAQKIPTTEPRLKTKLHIPAAHSCSHIDCCSVVTFNPSQSAMGITQRIASVGRRIHADPGTLQPFLFLLRPSSGLKPTDPGTPEGNELPCKVSFWVSCPSPRVRQEQVTQNLVPGTPFQLAKSQLSGNDTSKC
jgi:hypothetical protein